MPVAAFVWGHVDRAESPAQAEIPSSIRCTPAPTHTENTMYVGMVKTSKSMVQYETLYRVSTMIAARDATRNARSFAHSGTVPMSPRNSPSGWNCENTNLAHASIRLRTESNGMPNT